MTDGTVGSEVRDNPAAIDEVWLTDALEEAGVARGAAVKAVEFRGLIGTGQTGSNARFALTWDEPEGRPATVVAKFPSEDPNARAAAFGNGAYLKEWTFYTQVASTVRVRTPKVHVARFDPVGEGFVLLMEDMVGAVQGDQLAGLSADEAALAVEQAVALHAPRWGDAAIGPLLDGAVGEAERAFGLMLYYGATVDGFLARLGDRLDDDVVALVRAFAGSVAQWAGGTGTPRTVVHMDYRPDNFLFGREPGAPPLAVVDWQTVSAGLGVVDLSYMIGGGFEPATRATVERDLLASYRQQLGAAGIDYDADDCWRDYRFGTLWGIVITVIATVVAEATERGDEMFLAMASRHGRHALDLDAMALLQ
jgi:hypothetical protein